MFGGASGDALGLACNAAGDGAGRRIRAPAAAALRNKCTRRFDYSRRRARGNFGPNPSDGPNTYRDFKRRAWRQLHVESRNAGIDELWRYTADILYLLDNPVVREAFFPSGGPRFSVQDYRPADMPSVVSILERHDTGGIVPGDSAMVTRASRDVFCCPRPARGSHGLSLHLRASERLA